MRKLDKLSENQIEDIIHGSGEVYIENYGSVNFHELISIMEEENPPRALELLKTLSVEKLNDRDDIQGYSLLHYVDNIEILEYLMPRMYDNTIRAWDDEYTNVLYHSIRHDKLEKSKFIVNNIPANLIEEILLEPTSRGRYPLHVAIEHGMLEVCELIIDKISKEDLALEERDGEMALHWAIRYGQAEIAKLLINKMDPDALNNKNEEGETALHLAIGKSQKEICKLLLTEMSLEGLTCCPDYSKRNPYKHAEREDLLEIRDLIGWKIKKLKYPDNA